RVHNGDKCSCGESFEFTQKTIDELNKCLNNKNSSSPNDCVNNDNKINNYNNYNTPNCLKATVHDKRLLLLSSSGSYGHVESLIIPYGNIIFA
ncbi:18997_t:CDS:2, partial [Entrophospora sp. SA101]